VRAVAIVGLLWLSAPAAAADDISNGPVERAPASKPGTAAPPSLPGVFHPKMGRMTPVEHEGFSSSRQAELDAHRPREVEPLPAQRVRAQAIDGARRGQ